ncbi:ABC transporter ATP-binding protein [Desulfosporosinus shakirovi]|uniref:ABC transporter ATP-binding protein n=1 Tax=Desulfosporosinus shakirovi TaxID=2885154 RepID=UPI001E55277A|nr:sn-glycerol-3-phosphate ABC transporter ATP-binding protein UgpC [Desulfosporosinus sp. SRJS8]MCB8814782.1 sn-glycerol-3-phosphate ABC transporter ATP-binding protein UgpC [Desulfosporosinus sp. SRJS8]
MAEVELRDLSKTFGREQVVQHLNVTIEQGEFFVLVGPSGCGKSTTLRMIAGLEEISSGELLIDGKKVNHIPPSQRNISMVFQNYALYPHLNVKENILFGLKVRKVEKQEQKTRLDQAVEILGIYHLLERKPRELSGGQRQRVALGRAIVSQHSLCLMDEPLSNLDAKLRSQMRTEIRQLQKELGITMIYVTHDQIEAMTMGDRMMVLNEGVIQQVGKPLEVYNSPENLFVAEFLGAPPMNTLPLTWENQGINLKPDNKGCRLALEMAEPLKDGTPIVLGVRPENILPLQDKQDLSDVIAVPVTIKNAELLGSETIIEFSFMQQSWKAKWNGQLNLNQGSEIFVSFQREHIFMFNQESGKRLSVKRIIEIKGDKELCVS